MTRYYPAVLLLASCARTPTAHPPVLQAAVTCQVCTFPGGVKDCGKAMPEATAMALFRASALKVPTVIECEAGRVR